MPDPTNTTPPAAVPPAAETHAGFVPEAEVLNRIEKARQEEKSKLYGEIETLNNKIKTAEENGTKTASQLAEMDRQLQEKIGQLAAVAKAKTAAGEIDVPALIKETAEAARTAVRAETGTELQSLRGRLDTAEKEAKQARLGSLRQSLISAANGRIVAAMVTGDTEEALRQSAELAKQTYEDIAKASGPAPAAPALPAGNPPPPIAAGNGQPPSTGGDVVFQRTRDPKVFGQRRDGLMADLKTRFG
jgi:chaperonin cofactor prefoldin